MRQRRRGGFPARQRLTWALACLAALLNAVAPVLAYALGEPLHELAGGGSGHTAMHRAAALPPPAPDRAGAQVAAGAADVGDMGDMPMQRVDAPAVVHAAKAGLAGHAHAAGPPADGAQDRAPVAPHCPYCPDFAAGAALAPAGVVVPAPHVSPVNPAPVEARLVAARASLRLAPSRAPPILA